MKTAESPPKNHHSMNPVNVTNHDVSAQIARLFVYPVKSCAGIEVQEALLTDTGLDLDRAWMIVNAQGMFVTQREHPRLALVRPHIKTDELLLSTPGMQDLRIALKVEGQPLSVKIWDDEVHVFDMGEEAAQWLTSFLAMPKITGQPPVTDSCRLVRFDPAHRRVSSLQWTEGIQAHNQFSDGFPLLLLGEASHAQLNERLVAAGHASVSIERFRPNVVLSGLQAHDEDQLSVMYIETGTEEVVLKPVKPCPRCPIPNVDPLTAQISPEVGDTLQSYRKDGRVSGAVTFGMNTIVLRGVGVALRVGQTVSADFDFG
jgi:uncharacterized protein YcbX